MQSSPWWRPILLVASLGLAFEGLWLVGLVAVLGFGAWVMAGFEDVPFDYLRSIPVAAAAVIYGGLTLCSSIVLWRTRQGRRVPGYGRVVVGTVAVGNILLAAYAGYRIAGHPSDGPAFFGLTVIGALVTGIACLAVAVAQSTNYRAA